MSNFIQQQGDQPGQQNENGAGAPERPSATTPQTSATLGPVATTKPLVDIAGIRNVTELLMRRFSTAPSHVAFETRTPGAPLDAPWKQVSTRAFTNEVTDLAKGLIASGLKPRDTVLIMAPTQYLWAVADFAALFAGAIVVPVYDTASDTQLRAIIADANPVAAFAGDVAIARRISLAAEDAAKDTDSASPTVWVFDDSAEANEATAATTTTLTTGYAPLRALAPLGASVSNNQLEERRLDAGLDEVATIVYTSGTTGDPKGALITHRNLVGQVLNTAAAYREVVKETGNTILFLPLTHVLGRALQLICVANGMRVAHLSNPKEVVQALAVLKPTFLVVVPRVLEKIQAAATSSAREKKLEPVWSLALKVAQNWGKYLELRDQNLTARIPFGLRVQHALFDRIFFRRLRAVMGGKIEYLLSGAATLNADLALFFRGIGVPIIEGYGLTETTAPLTGGRPGALVAGSVGTPLPGNSLRIAANGEVLARGIGVFAGYRNEAHNAQAFVDGYFRTGDLGTLSADGSLTLNGRLKHIILTSTGRTISPESWEQAVESHPLVAHAALVGTDRPYLTALLVLDPDEAAAWFDSRGEALPPKLTNPGVHSWNHPSLTETLAVAVDHANAAVSPSERVQYWRVLTIGSGRWSDFVTPTMKLKRQALMEAAHPIVEELYR